MHQINAVNYNPGSNDKFFNNLEFVSKVKHG
jgi:hypothetical protein